MKSLFAFFSGTGSLIFFSSSFCFKYYSWRSELKRRTGVTFLYLSI
jgi:hypothetical protein